MKDILAFLEELKQNNNREWFQENISRYRNAQKEFDTIMNSLIEGISKFDSSIVGLQAKDCTYRIYRDVRFSPNKAPYKTNIGGYICTKGKKSGFAGYYLHLEPNSCTLSAGLYCPEPKVLSSVRDEIYDNGKAFVSNINKAKGFSIDKFEKLKRVPRGYSADNEYAEYLKLKNIYLQKPLKIDDNTIERTIADFKNSYPFIEQLNRAVAYAKENNR